MHLTPASSSLPSRRSDPHTRAHVVAASSTDPDTQATTAVGSVLRPAVLIVALALLATVAVALGAPPAAQAGDYTVSYCRDEAGNPRALPPDDWVVQDSGKAGDSVTETCASPGGGMRADWNSPFRHTKFDDTGWHLRTRGGGISIVGWDVAGRATIGANDTAFSALAATGNPDTSYVGMQCRSWQGCTSPDSPVGGTWTGSVDLLAMQLGCAVNPPDRTTCDGGAASVVERNVVTYRDETAPSASGTVRGPVTGTDPLAGTIRISGAATDSGVGVQRIALQVDGREVAGTDPRCRPPYDRQQPCPSGLDAFFDVDTTTIADGSHGATVVAVDGASNSRILWSGTVLVSNAGRIGPGSDAGIRGATNGSYGADEATITAGWPATSRGPSKSKAVQRRCKRSASYRRRHDVACNGRPGRRQLTVTYAGKKENLVRGRLTTKAGQPIAGATVQILASPRAVGLAPRVVARPTTDADGRFVGRVPVSVGSTSLSVDWLARVRDTVPAATTSMRRTVRATTTFTASPKRTVRRGRKLVLRGTLRATTGVRQGNAIAIQADAGNGWRAVKTVRTDAQGRWRAEYVVPTQLRGRYRFRAVVTPSAGYPFGLGRSSSRTIRIR